MDALPQLIPYGGATGLVILLLRFLLHDKAQWAKERAELVAEHRADMAESDRRHQQERADWDRWRESLQARIASLEDEVRKLTDELRELRGGS